MIIFGALFSMFIFSGGYADDIRSRKENIRFLCLIFAWSLIYLTLILISEPFLISVPLAILAGLTFMPQKEGVFKDIYYSSVFSSIMIICGFLDYVFYIDGDYAEWLENSINYVRYLYQMQQ